MALPLHSFVVPAWNEEELLPACLRALHASARAAGIDYEVVVADDASSDRTAELAASLGARVVSCEHRQIAATRNSGARAARGDRLVFVDADTQVTPEAVAATARAFEEGCTYGGANMVFDGEVPPWSARLMRWTLGAFRRLGLVAGAYVFCTREAFDAVGGFDETLYASEEVELAKALKRHGSFAWIEEAVVTSGRKVRAFTGWQALAMFARLAVGGKRALRRRDRLGWWYAEGRDSGARSA